MSSVSKPPFVLTYYNPFDKESPGLGKSFLNYVKDVSLANYAGKIAGETTGNIVGAFIAKASREQIDALERVSNELVKGFEVLDQRLELIRLEQFNTNVLLEDITELLKLPDSEKKRQRHIELGMKFSKSALKNEDLINDAIVEFNSALQLMPQDWFVMFQLAMCYMYFETIQNLDKAEELFLTSAKYSSVDSLEDSTLGLLFDESFLYEQQFENEIDSTPTGFTSECYLQLSTIKYIKSDFVNALHYAENANKTRPGNIKNLFFLAKYQSRCGFHDEALSTIKKAGEIELSIYKTLPADLDILSNPKFIPFFEGFKENQIRLEERKKREKEAIELDEILKCYAAVIFYEFKIFISKKRKELDRVSEEYFYNASKLDYAFLNIEYKLNSEQKITYTSSESVYSNRQEKIEYSQTLKDLARTIYEEHLKANIKFDKRALESDIEYRSDYWKSKILTDSQVLNLLDKYIQNIEVDIAYYTDHFFRKKDKDNVLANLDSIKLQKDEKKSNCFIATATMGDFNDPIVVDLTSFRDNWLIKRNWGRVLISCYYILGKRPARLIEKSYLLRAISKMVIVKPTHYIIKRCFKNEQAIN